MQPMRESLHAMPSGPAAAAPDGMHARLRMEHPDFALDIDLRLPGRGVTGVFGRSGSGKTTLLRGVAGLAPARGQLCVNGEVWLDTARRVSVPTHKRALGYVFQEASLFPHLSVRDNLLYGYRRIPPRQRRVELAQAASLLGVERLLERMPAGLSGGERQRVGIARALLASPRLLLMDEPLAALDTGSKQEILPYLERLHEELDIPVLYVSHAQEEIARLADHLVLMEAGRAIASGPIADMLSRLDLPAAMAGDGSVVIEGWAGEHDPRYGLLTVRLANSEAFLRAVHGPVPAGQRLRLAVQARDVSLALNRHEDGSILNLLPVRVDEIAATENPAHVLVRLDADGTALLARITRYSADRLALAPGRRAWAQVKAVSLLA